ncbi:MAG: pyridoxamine 5'-phosphate oxidase family protein [Tannerellaceae bacterium]|nr:pyridoxamine 5'-phosphate oxidase family protein [Tannerellaceae bacterium]
MKQYQIGKADIEAILIAEKVGRLATQNPDGFPYITPVHFVYYNERIYIHGLCKGQKISNIKQNSKVGFEVDKMEGLILSDKPCDVNTAYESVIIQGEASLAGDDIKEVALKEIVKKYTPQLSGISFPDNMIKATAVIEIIPTGITGKRYE